MKLWYNCKNGKNVFLKNIVEKRISEIIYSISEKNSEYTEVVDRIVTQKLQEIVADALIEADNQPEDLYTIFQGLFTFFNDILSKPFDRMDQNDDNVDLNRELMGLFVRDSAFQLMQTTYQHLFHKKLPLPTDVNQRLQIRKKNIKKTGKAGIDPEGIDLF